MKHLYAVLLLLAMTIISTVPAEAQVTLTQGTNFSVDAAADGRLAIDLLGNVWILPASVIPLLSGINLLRCGTPILPCQLR